MVYMGVSVEYALELPAFLFKYFFYFSCVFVIIAAVYYIYICFCLLIYSHFGIAVYIPAFISQSV